MTLFSTSLVAANFRPTSSSSCLLIDALLCENRPKYRLDPIFVLIRAYVSTIVHSLMHLSTVGADGTALHPSRSVHSSIPVRDSPYYWNDHFCLVCKRNSHQRSQWHHAHLHCDRRLHPRHLLSCKPPSTTCFAPPPPKIVTNTYLVEAFRGAEIATRTKWLSIHCLQRQGSQRRTVGASRTSLAMLPNGGRGEFGGERARLRQLRLFHTSTSRFRRIELLFTYPEYTYSSCQSKMLVFHHLLGRNDFKLKRQKSASCMVRKDPS